MKLRYLLLPVLLAALPPMLHAADSKRTAEYYLITPTDFEGKEVTLDVAFVKPTHWKSPIPELAFFYALTLDRRDNRFGGGILVAIPSGDAEKFAKKYGTDFEGRSESNTLKGMFMAAPGGKDRHGKVWLVDTTGKVAELIKQRRLTIEEGEDGAGFGPGGPGGPGGQWGPGGPGPHRGPHRPGGRN